MPVEEKAMFQTLLHLSYNNTNYVCKDYVQPARTLVETISKMQKKI
jgi:hypothetical protein